MKNFPRILLFLVLSVFLVAGTALALPFNDRPIVTAPNQLNELQNVINGIGSTINVYEDQERAAIFTPTSGISSSTYIVTVSWNTADWPIEFGLYEYGDPTNTLLLFNTDWASGGTEALIDFDFVNNLVKSINIDTLTLIDSASLFTEFGFFISSDYTNPSTGTHIYYSEDDQNPDGIPAGLIYAGKGDNVTLPLWGSAMNDYAHWYVAMEGYGGVIDFSDFVAQFESIAPVPEPATMLLVGCGLIGLAGLRRKKLFKRS